MARVAGIVLRALLEGSTFVDGLFILRGGRSLLAAWGKGHAGGSLRVEGFAWGWASRGLTTLRATRGTFR